jgi:hypothetical protein
METTTDSPSLPSPPTGEVAEEALSGTASAGWSMVVSAVTSDPGEVSGTSEFSVVDEFGMD